MSTLNDLKFSALYQQGFRGSLNDMLASFYKERGAVTEYSWLSSLINKGGSLNDLRYEYLISQGFTGSHNDMLLSSLLDNKYFNSFSPTSLFAGGEPGAWYDPSDFSTLYQDAAGTTPVTAVGQPVGRILDKSGRGNHATQTTSTSRPVLQQDGNGKYYLSFDGVDDWLVTPSIDFTSTDKMTVFAGTRKFTDASFGVICELSANADSNAGGFAFIAANTTGFYASVGATLNRTIASQIPIPAAPASPLTSLMVVSYDRAQTTASEIQYKYNAAAFSSAGVGVQGTTATGNFGTFPLYIGRRNGTSLPFNGRIYSLIVLGAQSTAQQISDTETWVNGKTGAY